MGLTHLGRSQWLISEHVTYAGRPFALKPAGNATELGKPDLG